MKRFFSSLLCFSLLFFTACAAKTPVKSNASGTCEVLIPMPGHPAVDPPDEEAHNAVRQYLQKSGAPPASRYTINRYDLNNDGRRDALVIFETPYGYWCDTHGCGMLVLAANDKGFNVMNDVRPVREPVYISETQTNGWKDIIVRVSGRWDQTKNVALKFDGARYPRNPAVLSPDMQVASHTNARLFYD